MTVQLNDKFNSLPEVLQQEVMQFIDSLLQKSKNSKGGKQKNAQPDDKPKATQQIGKTRIGKANS